jgi:hypothetical protein
MPWSPPVFLPTRPACSEVAVHASPSGLVESSGRMPSEAGRGHLRANGPPRGGPGSRSIVRHATAICPRIPARLATASARRPHSSCTSSQVWWLAWAGGPWRGWWRALPAPC